MKNIIEIGGRRRSTGRIKKAGMYVCHAAMTAAWGLMVMNIIAWLFTGDPLWAPTW